MMVIGMGKQKGAESCHAEGFGRMAHNVGTYAHIILNHARILFGVGLVENAFDNTCKIEAIPTNEIKNIKIIQPAGEVKFDGNGNLVSLN